MSTVFFLDLFFMWTIFKVFIKFVTILLFFFLVFWLSGMWDLSILIRDQTHKDEVLTTGPPGKFLQTFFLISDIAVGVKWYLTEIFISISLITSTVALYTCAMAQTVKNLPALQETWVLSLGREDPLEEGMATHPSILAWSILWTEEPGRLYNPWGHKESDTNEQLSLSLSTTYIFDDMSFDQTF